MYVVGLFQILNTLEYEPVFFFFYDFGISPIQGLEWSFAQDKLFNNINQVKAKSQENIWKPSWPGNEMELTDLIQGNWKATFLWSVVLGIQGYSLDRIIGFAWVLWEMQNSSPLNQNLHFKRSPGNSQAH